MKNTIAFLILTICMAVGSWCAHHLGWVITSHVFAFLGGLFTWLTILMYFGKKVQKRHEENLVSFIKGIQKNLE